MSSVPTYRPPWWYRGKHLQTLWGPLLRPGRRPPLRRERVETPDGDFLDLDWLAGRERGAPLVIILHGLEGSARSHYAVGLLRALEALGWRGLVVHFRSCGGEVNRSLRMYHSGDTADLEFVVSCLATREPRLRVGLIGVSLGGNVILKWLGERGEQAPPHVVAAAAISTPFDLAACATVLDRGLNRRLYTASFLSTMKAKLDKKAHLYRDVLDLPAALKARTFAEYDRLVTAPLNGFADEHDYWARSSSARFLAGIRRPTLLINAQNDPFMPASALPRAAVAKSRWLEADFVRQGGHVGFLEGFAGRRSWAEGRSLAFLRRHLLG
jgi:predicted alpha/beta-fold hydrolase